MSKKKKKEEKIYKTIKFCEEHNITVDEIELSELKKILINDYGAEKFWELVEVVE